MTSRSTGCIVRSLTGHDSGKLYLIIGMEKDRALLADGKIRTLTRPKHKNIKHLQFTDRCLAAEEFEKDEQIRKALKIYIKENVNV